MRLDSVYIGTPFSPPSRFPLLPSVSTPSPCAVARTVHPEGREKGEEGVEAATHISFALHLSLLPALSSRLTIQANLRRVKFYSRVFTYLYCVTRICRCGLSYVVGINHERSVYIVSTDAVTMLFVQRGGGG